MTTNTNISLFSPPVTNTTDSVPIAISDVYKAIVTGEVDNIEYKTAINSIRSADSKTGKKERDSIKKSKLAGLTFSGLFNKRSVRGLEKYSGLICLDFDNIEAIKEKKSQLCKDPYTHICFVSPSGAGLKVIVKGSDDMEQHNNVFVALEQYYSDRYSLQVDKSGKDISRLCFISYDPEAFYNEQSKVFNISELDDSQPAVKREVTIGAEQSIYDRVEYCILQIEEKQIDITENYQQWLNIGFALANEFGETGRGFFHRASMYYPDYDSKEADDKYTNLVNTSNGNVTISTFFDCCKNAGIRIFAPENNPEKQLEKREKKDRKTQEKSRNNPEKAYSKGLNEKEGGGNAKVASQFVMVEGYLNKVYDFRNNNVNGELEYKLKEEDTFKPCKEDNIYVHLQRNGIKFSMLNLSALLRSDFVPVYDPFLDYFDSLTPYDSKVEPDHITEFLTYIKAKDQQRFNLHFRKMLVRIIACALESDVFNKQAFILVHDKQNSGKSTLCRWLCPVALKDYYSETFNGDKDSLIALTDNFLINLDELANLHKMELNALKTAISKDKVKVRRPYDKRANTYSRRASFVGSTNDPEFLTDRTGNVRWLIMEIEGINFDYSKNIENDNLWRQAYYLYKNNFDYKPSSEELQENEQVSERYQISNPAVELVQRYLSPGGENDEFKTTTDIKDYLIGKSAQADKLSPKAIGSALKSLGFDKTKEGETSTKQRWGYRVKAIDANNPWPLS